jgi:hypothetical protein
MGIAQELSITVGILTLAPGLSASIVHALRILHKKQISIYLSECICCAFFHTPRTIMQQKNRKDKEGRTNLES